MRSVTRWTGTGTGLRIWYWPVDHILMRTIMMKCRVRKEAGRNTPGHDITVAKP